MSQIAYLRASLPADVLDKLNQLLREFDERVLPLWDLILFVYSIRRFGKINDKLDAEEAIDRAFQNDLITSEEKAWLEEKLNQCCEEAGAIVMVPIACEEIMDFCVFRIYWLLTSEVKKLLG